MKIVSANINGQDIPFATLNLLVGPNNVGKSTLLRELHVSVARGMVNNSDQRWLSHMKVATGRLHDEIDSIFSSSAIIAQANDINSLNAIEQLGFRPFRNDIIQNLRNYNVPSFTSLESYINNENVVLEFPEPDSYKETKATSEKNIYRFLADIQVQSEFCDTRLAGGFSTSIQDILEREGDQSSVRHLRENPETLKNMQDNILKVFGMRIGFDNLQQGQKPLRILPNERFSSRLDQKSLAIKWRDLSPLLDNQGDGLKAYIKLALCLLDPFAKIIFIDEPETFLHPPQRRALGNLIADMAKQYDKQAFISTHDPEFIRGLLNSGNDVKVLNLKRQESLHEVIELDLKDIKTILNQRGNSLKERATILNEAILGSLFYEKTILVENENDRVFYEYYSSLRKSADFQNKHFIGLRGIDEVLSFMEKMHGIGINIACIVDIDFILTRYAPKFIKDDDTLHNAHVAIRQEYEALSKKARKALLTSLQKNGTKAIEDDSQRKRYEDLIDAYSEKSVYIPKVGVLESWTKTSKNNLSEMLRAIESKNPRELSKFMKGVLS